MSDLGLLTSEQEKQFGQFLDNLVDFTKFDGLIFNILEFIDGKVFASGITYLDDAFGDKINPEIKPLAAQFVLEVIAEEMDPDAIVETATNLLNELIDIPEITEDYEAIMIASILQGIVALVLNFVNKEDEEEVIEE